jgi:hypothetical protein
MLKNKKTHYVFIITCLGLSHSTQFCSEKADVGQKHELDSKKSPPPRISTSPTVTITPGNSLSNTPRAIPHPLAKVGAGFSLDLGKPELNITGHPTVEFSMKDKVPLQVTGTGDKKDSIFVEPTMSRDTGLRLAGIALAGSGAFFAAQGTCYGCTICCAGLYTIAKPKETGEIIDAAHNNAVKYGQQAHAWCSATGLPWLQSQMARLRPKQNKKKD